ncbi:hypothetical protein IEQ34_018638 [Dendrobium chrysotoxum]|uniref:Uncharacterized protein n=1 Tax=Dendrobium chrysotoxum TaxID=161865 RepID=A0AAV7G6N3_DENCH|nr:hypothetical protein IEQ34_018638 [Dendrobium chrysotoxum]
MSCITIIQKHVILIELYYNSLIFANIYSYIDDQENVTDRNMVEEVSPEVKNRKILESISYSDERNASLAKFVLDEEAESARRQIVDAISRMYKIVKICTAVDSDSRREMLWILILFKLYN